MNKISRWFVAVVMSLCFFLTSPNSRAESDLPLSKRFKGVDKFHQIVAKAQKEDWASLPIGERMAMFGREMRGTPYVSYTLEIDDHIEAPSANFYGLDCWSYFEIALGMSRMIVLEKENYEPQDLLDQIEFTRYRGGSCSGNYLERIHYLGEWFFENEARGVANDITRDFPYAKPITGRKIQEMTILWKSYRYLKKNPELRVPMAVIEKKVSQLPIYYIPKDKVHLIESELKNGDILGIATKYNGGFCSHVGMAMRTEDGVLRLAHATTKRKYRRVIFDDSISAYLNGISGHLGLIIARPQEVENSVHDTATYEKNLAKLTGGKGLPMTISQVKKPEKGEES